MEDVSPRSPDVRQDFDMAYRENLVKRRRQLFGLMATSIVSVVIMLGIDGYMHLFFGD